MQGEGREKLQQRAGKWLLPECAYRLRRARSPSPGTPSAHCPVTPALTRFLILLGDAGGRVAACTPGSVPGLPAAAACPPHGAAAQPLPGDGAAFPPAAGDRYRCPLPRCPRAHPRLQHGYSCSTLSLLNYSRWLFFFLTARSKKHETSSRK